MSSDPPSSGIENGPSEMKPGNIYIRSIKTYNEESSHDGNSYLFKEPLNPDWYSISEKHVERIIYDSDGFRIIFHHPLPPELSLWCSGNSPHNFKLQSQDDQTLLWIKDPNKNFKCFRCKIPYETPFQDCPEPGKLPGQEVWPELQSDLTIKPPEENALHHIFDNVPEIPAIWNQIIPNGYLSQLHEYKIKSPTLLLAILSFASILDWSIPLVSLLIIWLGLYFQEN